MDDIRYILMKTSLSVTVSWASDGFGVYLIPSYKFGRYSCIALYVWFWILCFSFIDVFHFLLEGRRRGSCGGEGNGSSERHSAFLKEELVYVQSVLVRADQLVASILAFWYLKQKTIYLTWYTRGKSDYHDRQDVSKGHFVELDNPI